MGFIEQVSCLNDLLPNWHGSKTPVQELETDVVESSWNLNLIRDQSTKSIRERSSQEKSCFSNSNEYSIMETQETEVARHAMERAEAKNASFRILRESLAREQDLTLLQDLVEEARALTGDLPYRCGESLLLEEEVHRAESRLRERRAEIKRAALEEHMDLYEHLQMETLTEDSRRDRVCEEGITGWLKHTIGGIGWVNHRPEEGESKCVVCLEQGTSHVMVPCGHQCVCEGER